MIVSLAEAPTVNFEQVLVGDDYKVWVDEKRSGVDSADADTEAGFVKVGDPVKLGLTINSSDETTVAGITDRGTMLTRKYSRTPEGYLVLQSFEIGQRIVPGASTDMFVSMGDPTVEIVDRQGLVALEQLFDQLAVAQQA